MDDENEKPYVPEFVPDELTDCFMWYEAVITELICMTGKTLYHTTSVNMSLQAMANRHATPKEAADWLIKNLGYVRLTDDTQAA